MPKSIWIVVHGEEYIPEAFDEEWQADAFASTNPHDPDDENDENPDYVSGPWEVVVGDGIVPHRNHLELATILAGLRALQHCRDMAQDDMDDAFADGCATLDNEGIDALIERLTATPLKQENPDAESP
jgi:hypothetical protein